MAIILEPLRRPGIWGAIWGAALVLAGCQAPPDQTRAAGQRAIAVETVTVGHISLPRHISVSGTLLSPDKAQVSSEVAGIVADVSIELGKEVKRGDVLVRLEPRELAIARARAQSELQQVMAQLGIAALGDQAPPRPEQVPAVRQAAANLDDARAASERAARLHERGLVSQVDLETVQTRLKVTEANYAAALDATRSLTATLQERRAAFELAEKKLEDASIKTPITGSVSERLVQPGQFIRENTPVATIVVTNPLRLTTAVQEKFASLIKPGMSIQFGVEAFLKETFDGRIAFVSPAVDQNTRTFVIEAIVNNDRGRLKPGFFAKGDLLTNVDENVPAVPSDAVSTMAGVSSVYVVQNDKIRQQTVTLGDQAGGFVEVLSGLKGTELLARSNLNQLATGVKVQRTNQAQARTPVQGDRP